MTPKQRDINYVSNIEWLNAMINLATDLYGPSSTVVDSLHTQMDSVIRCHYAGHINIKAL